MRQSLINTIEKYFRKCNTTDWIANEVYKFQFSNYLYQRVNWEEQTDAEILDILISSQKIKYANSINRGIQFIIKSGFDLKNYILIEDVQNFRKVYEGTSINEIDWSNKSMSYTGLSSWLSTLFPDKLYAVPMKGFDQTIQFLFDSNHKKFPKTGLNYILTCQPYLKKTETILKKYPLKEIYLPQWNKHHATLPELNIERKSIISKHEWNWIVQDFHLFTLREVLGMLKKTTRESTIAGDIDEGVMEGDSVLSKHLRYERNSSFIRKIKENAMRNNLMLNCEVCGFSFLEIYGEIGLGFIEAHHINPLNEREERQKTKKEDIALVCSNCHRMLHRSYNDRLLTITELKALIAKNQLPTIRQESST